MGSTHYVMPSRKRRKSSCSWPSLTTPCAECAHRKLRQGSLRLRQKFGPSGSKEAPPESTCSTSSSNSTGTRHEQQSAFSYLYPFVHPLQTSQDEFKKFVEHIRKSMRARELEIESGWYSKEKMKKVLNWDKSVP